MFPQPRNKESRDDPVGVLQGWNLTRHFMLLCVIRTFCSLTTVSSRRGSRGGQEHALDGGIPVGTNGTAYSHLLAACTSPTYFRDLGERESP